MPRIAQSPADLLSQSEALQLSGLEFMQAILDGNNPGPPIGQTMGYALHSVKDGRIVFRGAPSFAMTNPMGTLVRDAARLSNGLRRHDKSSPRVGLHHSGIQN